MHHSFSPNRALFLSPFAALIFATGCLYDGDDRCGPGEVLGDTGCICADGLVPIARPITALDPNVEVPREGCQACGDNERADGESCVCADGFERAAEGAACMPSNVGVECLEDAICSSGSNPHCEMPALASMGYCTRLGCSSDEECNTGGGYRCVNDGGRSYCRRPPLGEGAACTPSQAPPPHAGCTAEAPICNIDQTCVQAGCVEDSDCSYGRSCCDLSQFTGFPTFLCLRGCP